MTNYYGLILNTKYVGGCNNGMSQYCLVDKVMESAFQRHHMEKVIRRIVPGPRRGAAGPPPPPNRPLV